MFVIFEKDEKGQTFFSNGILAVMVFLESRRHFWPVFSF